MNPNFPIEEILMSEVKAIRYEIEELEKRHSWSLNSSPERKELERFLQVCGRTNRIFSRIIKGNF